MSVLVVPVIDLDPWFEGTPEQRRAVADQVDEACRTIGFLQVRGHRIPDEVVDAMRDATSAFFALPPEEKQRWTPPSWDVNRGYAGAGSETLSYSLGEDGAQAPPDVFEAFNIGPDEVDLSDPAVVAERDRFFVPNIWPDRPASLRPALVAYFDEARRVAHLLTEVFAAALGLPEGFFRAYQRHATDTLRVNNYERRPGDPPFREGQMRMGAHTDYGIVTVLYADPVPSLQIVAPDGTWQDVIPEEGALLVNLGDLTAQWTNDRWRSTLHRVVPPPAGVDGSAQRRSVAFFHDGDWDGLVECLPTCTDEQHPPRYPPVLAGDHLMAKLGGSRGLQPSVAAHTTGGRLPAG